MGSTSILLTEFRHRQNKIFLNEITKQYGFRLLVICSKDILYTYSASVKFWLAVFSSYERQDRYLEHFIPLLWKERPGVYSNLSVRPWSTRLQLPSATSMNMQNRIQIMKLSHKFNTSGHCALPPWNFYLKDLLGFMM